MVVKASSSFFSTIFIRKIFVVLNGLHLPICGTKTLLAVSVFDKQVLWTRSRVHRDLGAK